RPEPVEEENVDNTTVVGAPSTTDTDASKEHLQDAGGKSTSTPLSSSSSTSSPSSSSSSPQQQQQQQPIVQDSVEYIPRVSSPTLSLAPSTALQKEQVDASNEAKALIERHHVIRSDNNITTTNSNNARIRRQRRRKFLSRVDYGMPSSHAQLVAFFVTYISLQLVLMEPEGSPGQWFLILLLQLYAWSAVWSRVQLGSHTVSQVLVGAGVGAIYGMIWFAIWSWKVEDMIKHWQWMDRYGVIQVRKIWRQLEMDEAVAIGRAGGRIYLREDQGFPIQAPYLRF
ncbi:hypothetical protein BGZ94_002681, partial [Podila epigama]